MIFSLSIISILGTSTIFSIIFICFLTFKLISILINELLFHKELEQSSLQLFLLGFQRFSQLSSLSQLEGLQLF